MQSKPKQQTTVYVALPVIDEEHFIGECLNAIKSQTYKNYKLIVCVNQPDRWWQIPEKQEVCLSNSRVMDFLKKEGVYIIDKSSKGNGWAEKNEGVGWARKTIMDTINEMAQQDDIILSVDADTTFGENYFQSVVTLFKEHPQRLALSNPYYHKLTGEDVLDRALLRYEIYMRCYALNMWHIGAPYSFTALGSAIALPVWAYRKIGGMTPKKSGEDFYFLQKLRKAGSILTWNTEKVYPATRYSDRVFFGTGPALIKGSIGNWESYPIYHRMFFDDIKKTYATFIYLFEKDMNTPLDDFILNQLGEKNIWEKLRRNCKSLNTFVAACHQKIDGLRILQYLKWKNNESSIRDENALIDFFKHFYPNEKPTFLENINFVTTSIEELNFIREFLSEKESQCQFNDSKI